MAEFVFNIDREPDMLLGEPVATFWDQRYGKPVEWNPSFAKSSHFETQPFLQHRQFKHFDFCGKSNALPQRPYVRSRNQGSFKPPPLSYQNQFILKPRGLRQVLEPKETTNYENIERVPNFAQKFVTQQTPMEELQRDFLRKNINQIDSSENRKDRDGLLEHLRQTGNLEQSDLQKPISTLIEKIHKTSDSDDPFLGDPVFQEILARSRTSRAPTQQDVKQAQKVQEIGQLNQNQSAGISGAGSKTPANPVPVKSPQEGGEGQPRRLDFEGRAFEGGEVVPSEEIVRQSTQGGASASASTPFGDDPEATRLAGRKVVRLGNRTYYVGRGGGIFASPKAKKNISSTLTDTQQKTVLSEAGTQFLNVTGRNKLNQSLGS